MKSTFGSMRELPAMPAVAERVCRDSPTVDHQHLSKMILNEVIELRKSTADWLEEMKSTFGSQIRETTTLLRSEISLQEERMMKRVDQQVYRLMQGMEVKLAQRSP